MSVLAPGLEIDKLRMMRIMRRAWPALLVSVPEEFGSDGIALFLFDSGRAFAGSVIVSQALHDGADWIHLSAAWHDSMPSYEDLAVLKDAVFGPDREAYQVFARASEHVNIHPYALHLWGRADGTPALPPFGQYGTI